MPGVNIRGEFNRNIEWADTPNQDVVLSLGLSGQHTTTDPAGTSKSFQLSGTNAVSFDSGSPDRNPTPGLAVGAVIHLDGASTTRWEIESLANEGTTKDANNAVQNTIKAVVKEDLPAGTKLSGTGVVRLYNGHHESVKDHLRKRNMGLI